MLDKGVSTRKTYISINVHYLQRFSSPKKDFIGHCLTIFGRELTSNYHYFTFHGLEGLDKIPVATCMDPMCIRSPSTINFLLNAVLDSSNPSMVDIALLDGIPWSVFCRHLLLQ